MNGMPRNAAKETAHPTAVNISPVRPLRFTGFASVSAPRKAMKPAGKAGSAFSAIVCAPSVAGSFRTYVLTLSPTPLPLPLENAREKEKKVNRSTIVRAPESQVTHRLAAQLSARLATKEDDEHRQDISHARSTA